MGKNYEDFINQSNEQFTKNDVEIGCALANAVPYSSSYDGISKMMLNSEMETNEMVYEKYGSTEKEFLEKIRNFKPYKETWELFSKAIMSFNEFMGYD